MKMGIGILVVRVSQVSGAGREGSMDESERGPETGRSGEAQDAAEKAAMEDGRWKLTAGNTSSSELDTTQAPMQLGVWVCLVALCI